MLYPEKLSKFDFKVRETIEKVRNCTKLPQSLINEILNTVMITLLKEKEIVSVTRNNDICTWNRGGKLTVEVLAKAIDHKSLQQLKKECKGLQTLLKNQHYLFEVSNGFVQFRSPESLEKISNNLLENGVKSKWKVRNCWFYDNHPDGCPLSNNICCYNHV